MFAVVKRLRQQRANGAKYDGPICYVAVFAMHSLNVCCGFLRHINQLYGNKVLYVPT